MSPVFTAQPTTQALSSSEVARVLAGLNFREILQVLHTAREPFTEQNLRRAVTENVEALLAHTYWTGVSNSDVSTKELIATLLDAAASTDSGEVVVGEKTGAVGPVLNQLMANGILAPGPDGRLRFAHRLIRDWWCAKKKPSA